MVTKGCSAKRRFREFLEKRIRLITQELEKLNKTLSTGGQIEKAYLIKEIQVLELRVNEERENLQKKRDKLVKETKESPELSILNNEIKELEKTIEKLEEQSQILADINQRIQL